MRRLSGALGAAGLALWSGLSGCGTEAKGIEACRQVELARCNAAVHCGLVEEATACELYFRDHCLHGVSGDEAPRAVAVSECVESIEAAGRCARRQGRDTSPAECGGVLESSAARDVCDIVLEPELAPDCAFLEPRDEDEDEDPDQDEDQDQEPEPTDADPQDAGVDAG
jgi:hypothetical protein